MDRMNLDQQGVEAQRAEVQISYGSYSTPLPGTSLKVDDDVLWLGVIPMRVLWGYEDPEFFAGYSPEIFGETYAFVEGQYIMDRAPADPGETPMPIYPQQAQQPQRGKKRDAKSALKNLLKQLGPDAAKKVRALFKAKKPELLEV